MKVIFEYYTIHLIYIVSFFFFYKRYIFIKIVIFSETRRGFLFLFCMIDHNATILEINKVTKLLIYINAITWNYRYFCFYIFEYFLTMINIITVRRYRYHIIIHLYKLWVGPISSTFQSIVSASIAHILTIGRKK